MCGTASASGISFDYSVAPGSVSGAKISNIAGVAQTNSSPLISVNCAVDGMVIRGVDLPTAAAAYDMLQVGTVGSVSAALTIRDVRGVKTYSAILIQGAVECLRVQDCDISVTQVSSDNGMIRVSLSTGALSRLIVDGLHQSGGNALLSKFNGAASKLTEVWLSNSLFEGTRRAFFAQNSDLKIHARGVTWDTLALNYVRADNADVVIFEDDQTLTLGGSATEIVQVNGGRVRRFKNAASNYLPLSNLDAPAASIQEHLDRAAAAGGGVVRMEQPGTFVLEAPLVIDSYVTLSLGPATRLTKPDAMSKNYSMIHNRNIGGTTDTNITIEGGIWDGNESGNDGSGLVVSDPVSPVMGIQGEIVLVGVDYLTVRDLTIEDCNGFAAQTQGNYQRLHDIDFGSGTRRDGLHVNGPSHHIDIRNIWGATHDDMVALNAWDWGISAVAVGDITDVTIDGLHSLAYESATASIVKLLCGTRDTTQANVRRVSIKNVSGELAGSALANIQYDYDQNNPALPAGVGEVSDVRVEGVYNLNIINAAKLLRVQQPTKNVSVGHVRWDETSVSASFAEVAATGSLDVLHLDHIWCDGYDLKIDVKGVVREITWSDCTLIGKNDGTGPTGSDNGWINVNSTGTLGSLTFANSSLQFAGSLFYSNNGTETEIKIVGSALKDVKHPIFVAGGGTVKAKIAASSFKNIRNNLARVDASALSVVEASSELTLAAGGIPYTLVNSGTVRHIGTSIGVDASKIADQVGDMFRNTNAALSCGAGVVLSDGTSVKNLFSGATY